MHGAGLESAQKSLIRSVGRRALSASLRPTIARCLFEPTGWHSSVLGHRQSVVGRGAFHFHGISTGMLSAFAVPRRISYFGPFFRPLAYFVSFYKCTDFRHSFFCALSQIFNLFAPASCLFLCLCLCLLGLRFVSLPLPTSRLLMETFPFCICAICSQARLVPRICIKI